MSGRVLITRDLALCGALPEKLRKSGHVVFGLPVTETMFMSPELPDLSRYDWIAFTSANAVRGLALLCAEGEAIDWSRLHIAAVGRSTAKVVSDILQRCVDIISIIADGPHLALAMTETLPPGARVLYPCAAEHDSLFTHICRSRGLHVDELPVYRTLPKLTSHLRDELSALGNIDAALFYAPSAVRSFRAAYLGKLDFAAIAIGPTTLFALEEAGFKRLALADSPNVDCMVRAVEESLTLVMDTNHA